MSTSKFTLCLLSVFFFKFGYTQDNSHSPYHLFNPTPKEKMRDMETDRPDVTESPFTVDAGHFQYEADLGKLVYEKDELTKQRTFLLNQGNLKLGITNTTDLQLIIQTFGSQREIDLIKENQTVSHGTGDLTIRVKQNLIGNGGGSFALAFLPYVKIPTSNIEQSPRFEGGLVVPMQVKLPHEWKLGLQVEGDRIQDKYDRQMHTELLQSITVSHEILKGIEGIAETYYTYDFKQHHWANFLNAAMQISLSDNFRIDTGLNYGIQSDAEKTYFVGTSFRF
jgi:hypothetical protein